MSCFNCNLAIGRNNIVYGKGSKPNYIMILGGVPSYTEDKTGIPFVSKENKLLIELLKTIDITSPYITNVVKCIASKNRMSSEYINVCLKSFLYRELQEVNPRVIITVGKIATELFMQSNMKDVVSNMYIVNGYHVIPLYDIKYYTMNNNISLLKDHINKIKLNLYRV